MVDAGSSVRADPRGEQPGRCKLLDNDNPFQISPQFFFKEME